MLLNRFVRLLTIGFISTILLFKLFDILFPLDLKQLQKPLSTLIYDDNHELIQIKLSSDAYYRFKADPKEIPKLLKESILSFEDRYFYTHFGINPVSIVKAIAHNLKSNRAIGASTITMQVARMMQHKKRTMWNKLGEMMRAFQLEWHYSKDEILTFYFNLAPYGGNIDGIKTAAWFYFQKELSALSIAEIAILTTIPKNPNANRPDRAKNLYEKRLRVLRILLKQKLISLDAFNRAFKEPMLKKRFKAPFIAPHFSAHLKEEGRHHSTLNLALQNKLLKTLQTHVDQLQSFGLHNAAGIVIHNPSMTVKAYVGSDRFFNKKNLGQNNGVTMIRSPGSSLKPFVYAKALDQGLITPKKELFDIPIHIKGYDPQNYTRSFAGEVSAEIALQDSLNIPAVELNKQLKKHSLYELLKKANIKSITQPKLHYGDSIALGGFGISLLDLAHLYTTFAHEGELKSLGFTKNFKSEKLSSLFSKQASYITTEILSDAIRPEFSAFWESAENMPRIAFKTGTSANSKDLYTIGVTPEYTVAIWMGNFSGNATKDLTGMDSSSPALFEMFSYLQQQDNLTWFTKPNSVVEKEICSDAIQLGKCINTQHDLTIKGVTLQRPCELLRAEVLAFLMEKNRITEDEKIKHDCYEQWNAYTPLISSLYDQQIIIKNNQNKEETQELMLKCYTFQANQTVTWLVNNQEPFKVLSQEQTYIKLPVGKHKLTCLDHSSQATTINIEIKEDE
jgi:penicillin-binding protein 1C